MKKIIALTLALIVSLGCFSLMSFATETEEVEHLTEVPDGYVGVYTKDDLYAVRENPSGKYILMNDIVFEDADYVKGGDFYNSGTGWEPIGTSSTPFQGMFDGNGYTIYNLYINAPNEYYQGLFGYVNLASFQNVCIVNSNIIGYNCVGSIVGYGYSTTIKNSIFNGTIIANKSVGGIVGELEEASAISKCTVYGTITGEIDVGGICGLQYAERNTIRNTYCRNVASVFGKENVGGICGRAKGYRYKYYETNATGKSEIYYSCNTGDIISLNKNAGGIIGYAEGDIHDKSSNNYYAYIGVNDSYNIGNVTTSEFAGGIIGTGKYFTCYHTYSIGTITANSNFGGCFGSSPSIVTFCYYLDDAVTNPTCTAGMMKSIDQLKRKGNYEQWDFDTVWTMEGREDYIYPELRDVPLVFSEDFNHKHEYTPEVTTPATHLATGTITYTCECGDTYTEDIDKIADHSYEAVITAPTCIAKGYTTYTCECNDSYIADYVDAKGHDFKATVTEPDCTEFGYTMFACECGESYISNYVNANGHIYTSEITTPATHLAEGVETFACECGDTYTKPIAKTATHTYVAVITAPTCTAKGYIAYTCECGDRYVADYTNIIDHEYTEEVTIQPTHNKEGLKTYTCECGYSYTEILSKTTEHSYTSEITTLATHTTEGVKTFTCECGDSYTEVVEKTTDHTYTSEVTTQPTHTKEGVKTFICECGDSYTDSIAKIEEHTYSATVTNATCTADGYTTYTCACGDTYKETINSTGHNYDGSKCVNCGDDKSEVCNCNCHKSGISAIIWKIINIFNKLLKKNPVCSCGVNHY